jgi:hypothetical protein
MDAEDSQFRIQARTSPAAALAGAVDNGAVGGADEEDQATEQADTATALLRRPEGAFGFRYFFFAASWRAA